MTANGPGFTGERFVVEFHFAHGGTGDGKSEDNPAAIEDQDIMAIPAGTMIEAVDLYIETGITGTTDIDIGDDDQSDDFLDGSADVSDFTAASYNVGAGAYLTSGAKKFYSAAGKEVKMDASGASTAGKGRVLIFGYRLAD